MNKIVREHFPAHKLPEELRGTIDPSSAVTVVITEEEGPEDAMTLEEIFALEGLPSRSAEDIDAELRDLREEWHERR
jgi:hypothetical protein